jgi:hypothetical protein
VSIRAGKTTTGRHSLAPNRLVSQHGTLYSISRCVVIASSSARSRRNQILSKIALKHLMSANRRWQGILVDPSSSEAASEMVAAALMQPEHVGVAYKSLSHDGEQSSSCSVSSFQPTGNSCLFFLSSATGSPSAPRPPFKTIHSFAILSLSLTVSHQSHNVRQSH